MGIDFEVIKWLFEKNFEAIYDYQTKNIGGFNLDIKGNYGTLKYATLSDGVLRVDLSRSEQVLDEILDVPPY